MEKEENALNRAYTYIIINTMLHTIMRWSIGKYIIVKANEKLMRKRSSEIHIELLEKKDLENKLLQSSKY